MNYYLIGWKIGNMGYTWDIFKYIPAESMHDFVNGYISGTLYRVHNLTVEEV